jgi:muconolactone delta-isomerase
MQFLSVSRQKDGVSDAGDLAIAESRSARILYAQGSIRQIWHRYDVPGACILWEAESEQQVRDMLGTLPFARAGMIEFLIIPLRPYEGFRW